MKKVTILAMMAVLSLGALAQLPSVTLKTIEGKTINTAELNNDGKPFIIAFFGLHCKPCLRELNAIHEVYVDWQDETGVKLIAVSIDMGPNAQRVKPLVDSSGWEYEVLLDPNSDFLRAAMNTNLVPAVMVVDGKGNIVHKHTSYTDGAEENLIKKVRELVK